MKSLDCRTRKARPWGSQVMMSVRSPRSRTSRSCVTMEILGGIMQM